MGTIAITGSAGGIGAAARARFEAAGHTVIGIDVREAEVIADLSTPTGRDEMASVVEDLCEGVLDGVIAGAGVSGQPGELVVSINYFGAIATLEKLRPMLIAHGGSAVAISSNSTTCQQGYPDDVVEACLAGDEEWARSSASHDQSGLSIYPAAKLALARWVRHQAVSADWIGAGINLNAIAPGLIKTPMTEEAMDFIFDLGDAYPIPIHRAGTADEVAALLELLIGPDGGFFCGSFIVMDGGTEAVKRGEDWPAPIP